jgi:hypothetical protein
VQGDGYRFEAPETWTVSPNAASHGPVDRIEVQTFRLVRPYRAELRAAAATTPARTGSTSTRR